MASKKNTAFRALDSVDIACSDLVGTIQVLSALIDNDAERTDPDLLLVIERHLRADVAALDRAREQAFAALKGGAT